MPRRIDTAKPLPTARLAVTFATREIRLGLTNPQSGKHPHPNAPTVTTLGVATHPRYARPQLKYYSCYIPTHRACIFRTATALGEGLMQIIGSFNLQ